MTEITMPKLSDSMADGTILTWLKHDGDRVQIGDELVEIETDKATMTYEAEASGILEIAAAEGTTVSVGAPIAHLGDSVQTSAGRDHLSVQTSDSVVEPSGDFADAAAGSGAGKQRRALTDVKATPLARRAAQVHGLSLEGIRGSGPHGRVTRGDVLAKVERSSAFTVMKGPGPPRSSLSPAPGLAAEPQATRTRGDVEVVELTRAQTVVARLMVESKATVPEFQVQTDVPMDQVIAFRSQIKEAGLDAPSVNDLLVKATALALRRHARVNGSYRDGRFELYSRVNVGIAVAADNVLVVPTIFDADQKSLAAISAESRRLAKRVRERAISPPELSGATFTVSNLGMYGMTAITPVINPPQAAILGAGALRTALGRTDGEIVDRHFMTLTLSCDHRILYGADAARFLADLRELLEQPLRLVL